MFLGVSPVSCIYSLTIASSLLNTSTESCPTCSVSPFFRLAWSLTGPFLGLPHFFLKLVGDSVCVGVEDVETVDNLLPGTTRMWLMCVVAVCSTLTVISASTPVFLSIILPLGVIYFAVLVSEGLVGVSPAV